MFITTNIFSYEEGISSRDNINIYYRDYGPADGDPILLVQGLGGQLINWPNHLIPSLKYEIKTPIKILIIADVIIHKFHGKSFNITENKALIINTINFGLVLIETATIAMKDKGIT